MSTKTLLTLTASLLALALSSLLVHGDPLGTAFSYQGKLAEGGAPANGHYDFHLTLHDAASGGAQIGAALTTNSVSVNDGLFAITLDFGAGAFNGAARWLDIAVRTNGAGVFTPLTPRQPLTPTPYALYAPSAGTAATSSSLEGTLPDAQLSGNVALRGGGNTLTGNQEVSGGNLILDNGKLGIGTATPQTALDVVGDGRMLSLDLKSPRSHLAFNAWYDTSVPAWRRIGAGFASALAHHDDIGGLDWSVGGSGGAGDIADMTLALHVAPNGNVGVGTFYPAAKLEVAGNLYYSGQLSKLDVAEFLGPATVRSSDFNFGSASRRGTPGRALVDFLDNSGTNHISALIVNFKADWPHLALDGNVGINNWNSRFPLSLGGMPGNTKLAIWDDGTYAVGFGVQPDQFRLHLAAPSSRFSFLDRPDGNELLTVLGTGNIGIGNNNPTAKLEVRGGPIKATGGLIIETRTDDPTPPTTGQIWLRTNVP